MSRHTKRWIDVYAVVRHDRYLEDLQSEAPRITIKEILPTQEEAEDEVRRLNSLMEDERSRYFWQYSRYYPDGV